MNTSPMSARPRTARSPVVKRYIRNVTSAAPTAGPSQWRVPPSAAIRITYSAAQAENVSAAVT